MPLFNSEIVLMSSLLLFGFSKVPFICYSHFNFIYIEWHSKLPTLKGHTFQLFEVRANG